jgi:hypothetical protein
MRRALCQCVRRRCRHGRRRRVGPCTSETPLEGFTVVLPSAANKSESHPYRDSMVAILRSSYWHDAPGMTRDYVVPNTC